MRKRFETLFRDILKTQLILKGVITKQDWELIKNKISFDFVSDNHFKELKETDILRERLSMVEQIQDYVGVYYSMNYVRKKILQMTDEDIENMQAEMENEAEEMERLAQQASQNDAEDEQDEKQ